ncbi:hypothetical protein O3P69_018283 [Scylla paramamosain]|uniref:Uncharacterized protein n=1 Tax=Scylla paramamosain TaxID=85552 RepID=A0AAW0TJY7_SCYPA
MSVSSPPPTSAHARLMQPGLRPAWLLTLPGAEIAVNSSPVYGSGRVFVPFSKAPLPSPVLNVPGVTCRVRCCCPGQNKHKT